MKWTNRQYIDMMTYNNPERPMFSELFGPLSVLENEWRAQGASEDMISMHRFAFDYVPYHGIGRTGAIHMQKEIVLEEDENHYLGIDGYGRRVRLDKTTATIALPETFPVETMDDWLKIKHMFLYEDSRVTDEEIDEAIERQKQGEMIVAHIPGGYDILRELMGEVNLCYAFYDEPEMIEDILTTIGDTCVRVLDRISKRMVIDQLSVHEDMAGKSGPLIGPNLVSQYINPYYRRSWDLLSANGTKLFCQDSDGNMNVLIDTFMEAGVNVFYPCEPAAGMDIVQLRKKYGHKIAFRGGIDKHVLRGTKEDIDRELAYKLQPCMLDGGIVLGLDHRITNGTPLENYIYYVDRAREILGLPDWRTCEPGWGRMAF